MTNTQTDPYRLALFYTLGLMEETRNHIELLYDFEDKSIRHKTGFVGGWHTSMTMRIVRLAFNLYNGCSGEDKEAYAFTPYHIFDCNLREYFFEAIRLRYEVYRFPK
jgi:hypothetical protein